MAELIGVAGVSGVLVSPSNLVTIPLLFISHLGLRLCGMGLVDGYANPKGGYLEHWAMSADQKIKHSPYPQLDMLR